MATFLLDITLRTTTTTTTTTSHNNNNNNNNNHHHHRCGKRPDKLTLVPWQRRKPLSWDVTVNVICPLADSYVELATQEAGEIFGLGLKVYDFQPVAVETLGPLNKSACEFLSSFSRKMVTTQAMIGRPAFYCRGFLFWFSVSRGSVERVRTPPRLVIIPTITIYLIIIIIIINCWIISICGYYYGPYFLRLCNISTVFL